MNAMDTPLAADRPITGAVQFYGRPEPLSVEWHGNLGIKRLDMPFGFAEASQAVPLQVTEFGFAAKSYPVIFAGADKSPMAVMSIRPGENLFISRGMFEPDVYVPAFIRRYPFVLAANTPEADTGPAPIEPQMIVCIDRAAESLIVGGDVPLFEGKEPSDFSKQMIEFCTNFERERQRTEFFVKRLKELDLFEAKQATFTPQAETGELGQPVMLADYFAVSDRKLTELPAEVVMELHLSGALRQIYAHLDSIQNWERLVARSATRNAVVGHA